MVDDSDNLSGFKGISIAVVLSLALVAVGFSIPRLMAVISKFAAALAQMVGG